ncbi:hypothetical protein PR048_014782 [Dryococelus australis]|uniref:Uncharacterized protein n=1 Tax=Dryococelus australis TaxID=614101 RepID=A0ABQ9HF49_9NEOP|nr:hypothetical protein PR048_014782 [Dryococelus australis]
MRVKYVFIFVLGEGREIWSNGELVAAVEATPPRLFWEDAEVVRFVVVVVSAKALRRCRCAGIYMLRRPVPGSARENCNTVRILKWVYSPLFYLAREGGNPRSQSGVAVQFASANCVLGTGRERKGNRGERRREIRPPASSKPSPRFGRKTRMTLRSGLAGTILLASHLCEPGSISCGIAPGFSHIRIVPDDAASRRVISGISGFPRHFIPVLLHTHFSSPSSALNTSMLITAHISSRPQSRDNYGLQRANY